MVADSQSFREVAQCLGPDRDLVAIRTSPLAGRASRGVLLLNAGVVHRVGPHRLNVALARRLASLGLTSWRLDLSGIGDSRPIPGRITFRESAVQDIRLAMDEAGTDSGIDRFTLVGLCSGADNALAAAAKDARIDELVLIDAPAYATPQSERRQRWSRVPPVRGPGDFPRWLLGCLRVAARLVVSRNNGAHGGNEENGPARKLPTPAEFESSLTLLANRGVRVLLVYSGALGARYNAQAQLFESFPTLVGRVEVMYFPDANHVFTEVAQRSALMTNILGWMGSTVATPA